MSWLLPVLLLSFVDGLQHHYRTNDWGLQACVDPATEYLAWAEDWGLVACGDPLVFSLLSTNTPGGVAALDDTITINGADISPTFRYSGGEASASGWTADIGTNLVAVGAGGAFDQPTPMFGVDDLAWAGAGSTRRFRTASGSIYDVTTEDLIGEFIFQTPTSFGTTQILWSKLGTEGYSVYLDASGVLTFEIDDGPDRVLIVTSTLDPAAYYHAIAFLDRSGFGVWYLNGIQQTPIDISAVGSLTTPAINFSTGFSWASGFAHHHMWFGGGILDTHLQADEAQRRFQKYAGFYGDTSDTINASWNYTRASTAYTDQYITASERRVFRLGDGWPRLAEREDTGSTQKVVYVAEPGEANTFAESEVFGGTSWTGTAIASISADAIAGPDGFGTADGIVADNTGGAHYVSPTVTGTVGTDHIWSVWAKAGNKNWLYLTSDNNPNNYSYFDLSNCTTGTVGSFTDIAFIEDWGNGWCRCGIAYDGTAAHIHQLGPADSDGVRTFSGDNVTINVYLWGAQHGAGRDYMPAYVRNDATATTATTAADVMYYDVSTVLNAQGTLYAESWAPNIAVTTSLSLLSVNDGAASAEQAHLYSPLGVAGMVVRSASVDQASITGTTDISDGDFHTLRGTWQLNNVVLYVDGVSEGTPDTSATAPTGLDRLYIGTTPTSSQAYRYGVRDLQLYRAPRAP